jgi:meiotic recombination protein DMC1
MLSKLNKLAAEYNIAIVLTNQVIADPGGGVSLMQDVKKPVGGHVLAHASTTRLYVRKGKGDERCIKVVDSPMLAEDETVRFSAIRSL